MSTSNAAGVERERRDTRRGAAILVVLGVVATAMHFSSPDGVPESPHSAFSADQLLHDWPDADAFPVVVPERLPSGAAEGEGAGFALGSVVVDRAEPAAERVWVQYYESDALGGSFRVFQRPSSKKDSRPCGPMPDVLHLVRSIPGGTFTVCSSELGSDAVAAYWSSVELTQDVTSVPWLASH